MFTFFYYNIYINVLQFIGSIPSLYISVILYISNLNSLEVLYDSRQSSLFDLMIPELKKSITEVEEDALQLVLKLPQKV